MDELEPPLAGRFTAALRHPPDGVLQPARWVRRLAALAAAEGVEIREHARVRSIEELDGATVIVCTDGYPSGLLGPIEGLIIPTRGQVIATEPIPERLFEVPHYGRHGFDYWHQAEDGRIVAGGFRDVSFETEFTADEELTEPVQNALHAFVDGLIGRELRVDYAWAGIFGMVMDFLPVVGRVAGARRTSGWRVATPATGTCSASPAASSWLGPCSARTSRCSMPSIRAAAPVTAGGEAARFPPGRGFSLSGYASRTVRQGARRAATARAAAGRAPSAFASAAVAIARSWIARPGRVEQRDVLGAAAALGLAREDAADLGHPVARDDAGLDAGRQLAAVPGLLPVVAEEVGARRARPSRPRLCRGRRRPSATRAGPLAASLAGRAPRARASR